MSDKVAEITSMLSREDPAVWITDQWSNFNNQREGKLQEWQELRNYLFATDTGTTTVGQLPWKNSTTLPKLTQIRDNLHSNYLSALFPNDDWMRWAGHSRKDATKKKRDAIQAYMMNKVRTSNFRVEASKLLNDYIDYGNAFVTIDFVSRQKELENGEFVPGYTGPVMRRISPLDITFNPLASDFRHSYKTIRSVKTLGEIAKMSKIEPENRGLLKAVERRKDISARMGGYSKEDFEKAVGYDMDGFGNLYEYYQTNYVELPVFQELGLGVQHK